MQTLLQSVDGNALVGELIKVLPNYVIMLVILIIVIRNWRYLNRLLRSITHFGAFGVEMDFGEAKAELRNAISSYITSYR